MKKLLMFLTLFLMLTACNEVFYYLPPEPSVQPYVSSSQRVIVESNSTPTKTYTKVPGQVVVR